MGHSNGKITKMVVIIDLFVLLQSNDRARRRGGDVDLEHISGSMIFWSMIWRDGKRDYSKDVVVIL